MSVVWLVIPSREQANTPVKSGGMRVKILVLVFYLDDWWGEQCTFQGLRLHKLGEHQILVAQWYRKLNGTVVFPTPCNCFFC